MTQEHQIIFRPFRLEVPQGRLWWSDQVLALRPRSLGRAIWPRILVAW